MEVWGEVGVRYVIIVCTNFKGGINVRLVYSEYWGVIVGDVNGVCRSFYGELMMYNMYYVWSLMSV